MNARTVSLRNLVALLSSATISVCWMRTDAIAQDPQETELADACTPEETKGDQQSSDAPPGGKGLKVEGIPGHFSVTLVFSTDYVFRGLSFSERNPSGQGFLNWSHDSARTPGFSLPAPSLPRV